MPKFFTAEATENSCLQAKGPSRNPRCERMCWSSELGPTGLACAIEAQKLGLKVIVVDKGCLVNSLFHYPAGNVIFHHAPSCSKSARFPSPPPTRKPTREEALEYYRKVSEHYQLDIRQYEWGEDSDGRRRRLQHHGEPTAPGRAAMTTVTRQR